jgi:membrane protease YdiL (CAAX protease family)
VLAYGFTMCLVLLGSLQQGGAEIPPPVYITSKLTAGLPPGKILHVGLFLLLAVATAIGDESLFRGVVQQVGGSSVSVLKC